MENMYCGIFTSYPPHSLPPVHIDYNNLSKRHRLLSLVKFTSVNGLHIPQFIAISGKGVD